MSQPFHRAEPVPLTNVKVEGTTLRFTAGNLSFDIRRRGEGYDGTVYGADKSPLRVAFVLRPGTPSPKCWPNTKGPTILATGGCLRCREAP